MPKHCKTNDGRYECCLCPRHTRSQPVVLLYDPTQSDFEKVRRAHLSCLLKDPSRNLLLLRGDDYASEQ